VIGEAEDAMAFAQQSARKPTLFFEGNAFGGQPSASRPTRRSICYIIPPRSAHDRPYDQAGDKLGQVGSVSESDKAAQAVRPPLRAADTVAKVDVDLAKDRPRATWR
jgi:hypothetical protein